MPNDKLRIRPTLNVWRHSPLVVVKSLTVLSDEADANKAELYEKATEYTC